MSNELLAEYTQEVEIEYKGEVYLVRDNGAVNRRCPPGKRKRKLDDEWTFGRQDNSNGYMVHGSHVIHRIVARAFHPQPTLEHVVDHIDTNRANNRADNLRWLTRIENVLLNPITLKRVIHVYGSLDAFFRDPSSLAVSIPEFGWMRTVSKAEAEESRKRLHKWAESGAVPRGGRLGEWIFGSEEPDEFPEELQQDVESATPGAVQRNWKTICEFPACPSEIGSDPLGEYAAALKTGSVFSRNPYGESLTEVSGKTDTVLCVLTRMSKGSVKDWALAKVTLEEGKFVHEALGTYFSLEGAMNEFNEVLGIDAPRVQTIDDLT